MHLDLSMAIVCSFSINEAQYSKAHLIENPFTRKPIYAERFGATHSARKNMAAWQNEPFAIDVKAGETKAFCACGLSKNGPYCDGSHKTTDLTPHMVKFDQDKTVYACGCQQSANRPYCDGSHKK